MRTVSGAEPEHHELDAGVQIPRGRVAQENLTPGPVGIDARVSALDAVRGVANRQELQVLHEAALDAGKQRPEFVLGLSGRLPAPLQDTHLRLNGRGHAHPLCGSVISAPWKQRAVETV